MASDLMTKSSIYGSDAPVYGGASETPIAAATGEHMDDSEPVNNPIKAIVFMLLALVGIRFLWEVAKDVT